MNTTQITFMSVSRWLRAVALALAPGSLCVAAALAQQVTIEIV